MARKKSGWIWTDRLTAKELSDPLLVYFRKKVTLREKHQGVEIKISADTRYKLYVNGAFVEAGPSKGDREVWFVDTVDIAPYLRTGENIIAVKVLRYPLDHDKGNHGIFRTEHPGLYVWGFVEEDGVVCSLCADESWKVSKYANWQIVSESDWFAPLKIYEEASGDARFNGWDRPGYDDKSWDDAVECKGISRQVSPGNLIERTIPYLFKRPGRFEKVMVVRGSASGITGWNAFLKGGKAIEIAPHSKETVEISAGMIKTGYLHLSMEKGKGAKVTLLQSESYVLESMVNGHAHKGNREDCVNGFLEGFTDVYTAGGYGTEEDPEVYEPFWFRCFRFIGLTIETGDDGMVLRGLDYTETGYPLEPVTEVETSDPALKDIWDMSLRTLRLCMHETYEDCPFYEQLQYIQDSRAQMLFTYSVAADDRLARKCMDDFRRSQRYDGLLNGSYPNYGSNVIPGFSVFYILMLYDHMMYFGDKELLEDHFPALERILRFYHTHLTEEGYVEKIGGLNGPDRFWSFVDWAPEWDETNGVPACTLKGPITHESLLYIYGLQHAELIARYLGRSQEAYSYAKEAAKVREAVKRHCMSPSGFVLDGPGAETSSQHGQVFGILTGVLDRRSGRRNLLETLEHKEKYPQCSVAMTMYLYRALQMTGLYERTRDCWGIWKNMLSRGALTCVEDNVSERSECHAWGALALYELPSVILGVRPAAPGYKAVCIDPEPGYLTSASGCVLTPKGMITVSWELDGELRLRYAVPEGMEVVTKNKEERA